MNGWVTHVVKNDYGTFEIMEREGKVSFIRIYEYSSTSSADLDVSIDDLKNIYDTIGEILIRNHRI